MELHNIQLKILWNYYLQKQQQYLVVSSQNVFATGCPINFVEHIQNAKAALQNGDTQEAMNQLDQAEQAIAMVSSEEE
jgi:hypothetical protein